MGEEIQSSNHLHVHSLLVTMPSTKMYCRYSWHVKNTWCFLDLFLRSMICWNEIEETLYPHLWICEQFCLFQVQSLTLQIDPPGQHKHWPFLPDLHRKMWWKEFLLHKDQALIGSSKFGHVGRLSTPHFFHFFILFHFFSWHLIFFHSYSKFSFFPHFLAIMWQFYILLIGIPGPFSSAHTALVCVLRNEVYMQQYWLLVALLIIDNFTSLKKVVHL